MGPQGCTHDFVVEQENEFLLRVVCTLCSEVRLEQPIDENFVLVWTDTDYRITSRFYRQLAS